MQPSKDVLRSRYNTFSNEALLAACAQGPGPYSPLAWEVIQELVKARGLDSTAPSASLTPMPAAPPAPPPPPVPVRPTPTPAPASGSGRKPAVPAPPPAPAPARPRPPEPAPSPYFIISAARRTHWPPDDDLPTTARDILSFAAMVFGVAGLALIVVAVSKRGPGTFVEPGTLVLAAAVVLSLAYAVTARRPGTPVTWGIALVYGAVAPALALAPIGSTGAAHWPRFAAGGLLGLLWVLYFARRRGAYGLKPWWWVL